jgi:hypothetical protein
VGPPPAQPSWSSPSPNPSVSDGWVAPQAVQVAHPAAVVVAPQAATFVPAQVATLVPPPAAQYMPPSAIPAPPAVVASVPSNVGSRLTPVPVHDGGRRKKGWTSPIPVQGPPLDRTALGYAPGAGAQSAVMRLGLRPGVASRLARLATITVPADFEVSRTERDVLNALGESEQLTARAIGNLIGVADPVAWMETLMSKLARYGLDLVGPGNPAGGEPTYVLRR